MKPQGLDAVKWLANWLEENNPNNLSVARPAEGAVGGNTRDGWMDGRTDGRTDGWMDG